MGARCAHVSHSGGNERFVVSATGMGKRGARTVHGLTRAMCVTTQPGNTPEKHQHSAPPRNM